MKNRALQILLLVNVALICVLAWIWVDENGAIRDVRWTPPEPRTSNISAMLLAVPVMTAPDAGRLLAVLDRPLFSITRRPPPPPKPKEEEERVDNLSKAVLSGLIEGAGVSSVIVNIAGKDRRVRLNEAVEGWRVTAVQGNTATFTRGGMSRVLQLKRAALNGVPSAAGPGARGARAAAIADGGQSSQRPTPSAVSAVSAVESAPTAAGNAAPSPTNTVPAPAAGAQTALPQPTFGGSSTRK